MDPGSLRKFFNVDFGTESLSTPVIQIAVTLNLNINYDWKMEKFKLN